MYNDISLSTGRNAISAYKKSTGDNDGIIELMVFYVERGNQFTVDFGDINEQFYNSLISMFRKIVSILQKSSQFIVDLYLPRLRAIVKSAEGIGWGYYGEISECIEEAFPHTNSLV
ncbi:hypothetical protein A3F66_00595 [candidate division TM6 bacterium RIFCSPHIGHO2_12_FULL_32_22]|nr:MAG: hypothetical protein A3F66_00595 [candidate division TM6 bacterium RIFCSPHIGHO2_12_FULL_32_22]